MPIFEFRCKDCGHEQEKLLQRVALHQTVWCDNCGGQMERVPSASSFVLKGAGFHANDYPKKS
jgi:putative FmdB family regulatory protein